MTSSPRPLRAVVALLAVPALAMLALAGCAGGPGAAPSASRSASPAPSASGPCSEVSVVVDFGALGHPAVRACVKAGAATEALRAAHVLTAGTADYGDQVICRVDGLPSPADESCATLPKTAYWAMWVRSSSGATWEYAQEGVTALRLTAGQSLGLVYTRGSDSTPPQD